MDKSVAMAPSGTQRTAPQRDAAAPRGGSTGQQNCQQGAGTGPGAVAP
jgi:hypothetical protein